MIKIPAEFDKIRKGIKKSLLDQGVPEEEAEKRSWAIATDQWKKKHGGKAPPRESMYDEGGRLRDADGRIIVAENVDLKFSGHFDKIEEVK